MKLAISVLAAAATLLAGCSAFLAPSITTGTTSDAVRAKLGAPSDERTIAGGTRAWDYVNGPLGHTTWRISFDGGNRVSRVEQLLTETAFLGLRSGETDKNATLGRLGRPAQISNFPNLREEVWTYRFMDGSFYKLGDIAFDAQSGKLKYVSTYLDPAYYNSNDT